MFNKLLLFMITSLMLVSCNPEVTTETNPSEDVPTTATIETIAIGLPNPASVYCEEQGYLLDMRETENGTLGICLFPDGSECEEWAYFRGECQMGDSLATMTPETANTAVLASDGCQLYTNEALGYQFHYPADAAIEPDDNPLKSITILGPLTNDEYWPVITVSHPSDREDYRPPQGVDLTQWLLDHQLLMTDEQHPAAEERQPDLQIAGETAVHTRFNRSPQSYAYDKYLFAHDGQLYSIVILHAGDKEDWELYNHFLLNFQFQS